MTTAHFLQLPDPFRLKTRGSKLKGDQTLYFNKTDGKQKIFLQIES
jgi:hypothetical protein